MKKILRFLSVSFLFILVLVAVISTNKVEAKTVSDDFEDVSFSAVPMLTDSKKFKCSITWVTEQKIKYLDVIVILANDFEQNPYQSGRDNCAGTFETVEYDGKYLNTLEFELYYYELGNIKTVFDYSYEFILDENDENLKTFTYIFITGSWSGEKKSSSAIIIGVIISAASALVTYVVVSNSQKNTHDSDEEDEIEDINQELSTGTKDE